MKASLMADVAAALSTWKTYMATLVLAALAAFLLVPLAKWVAFRWNAVDEPSPRKIHTRPMPRLGGLAVFGGFCFPWAFFYLLDNRVTATFQNYEKLFGALVLGATGMLALGVYDDIKGADATKKFLVQVGVACGLYWAGYRITQVSLPFGPTVDLGWLAWPASVFWIVGVTNAINLLDGIDGLATGVTACIALSLAMLNMLAGQIMVALLTLCLAGACLGFLPHNFSPARIFLGDSGSLSLGLILACIGIISLFKAATAAFLAVPLLLFALPLLDTSAVIVGRLVRGAHVFQADKTHVHHRLLAKGLSQKQAAILLYAITFSLGLLGIVLSLREKPAEVITVALFVLGVALLTWRAWRHRRALNGDRPGPT